LLAFYVLKKCPSSDRLPFTACPSSDRLPFFRSPALAASLTAACPSSDRLPFTGKNILFLLEETQKRLDKVLPCLYNIQCKVIPYKTKKA
jgi:hypothetical protein